MGMNVELMKRLAAAGRMSRREFMQAALATGVSVAAADRLFVSTVRAQPKKGGLFRIALGHGQTTDTLDPATWTNGFTFTYSQGLIGNGLTQINQKNAVEPDLAESFEAADGAKKWVFKLKKGVTFHNGKTVTADDVVASYNHHRGEDSKSAAKSILKPVVDVKADGPDTVIFELDAGSADFPYIASDYHLIIFPSADGKIDYANGVGTGPFILERFDPGVIAVGKRNPDYFGGDLPYFDAVELLSVLDVAARTTALTAGEIHYMDRIDLKTVGLLERNKDITITNLTGFAHYVAPIDVRAEPFNNVDVRLAIKWAIDREEIVKKVLSGYGTPGNDNPIAPVIKFATQPEPVYRFDPEKAKFHLKKAGYDSIKLQLSASDAAFSGAVDAAVLMKETMAKCGIDLTVNRVPSDGYWDNVWMKHPWTMSYWGGRPTADWMFTTAYQSGAAWNDTFWSNARFDELLLQARAETDDAKRATMYAEMQQLVHDDGGVIVLMFNNYVSAHSNKVAHGELNSNYDFDGGKAPMRWWFA